MHNSKNDMYNFYTISSNIKTMILANKIKAINNYVFKYMLYIYYNIYLYYMVLYLQNCQAPCIII